MQVIVFIFLVYEGVCSTRVLSTKLHRLTLVSAPLLLRPPLQKVKETRAGYPALGVDYIAQLEAMLHHWEQSV